MTLAQANRIVGWLMVAGGVALLDIAGLAYALAGLGPQVPPSLP